MNEDLKNKVLEVRIQVLQWIARNYGHILSEDQKPAAIAAIIAAIWTKAQGQIQEGVINAYVGDEIDGTGTSAANAGPIGTPTPITDIEGYPYLPAWVSAGAPVTGAGEGCGGEGQSPCTEGYFIAWTTGQTRQHHIGLPPASSPFTSEPGWPAGWIPDYDTKTLRRQIYGLVGAKLAREQSDQSVVGYASPTYGGAVPGAQPTLGGPMPNSPGAPGGGDNSPSPGNPNDEEDE